MKYSLEVNIDEICYNLVDDKGNLIAKGHSANQLKDLAMKLAGMERTTRMINKQLRAYEAVIETKF